MDAVAEIRSLLHGVWFIRVPEKLIDIDHIVRVFSVSDQLIQRKADFICLRPPRLALDAEGRNRPDIDLAAPIMRDFDHFLKRPVDFLRRRNRMLHKSVISLASPRLRR